MRTIVSSVAPIRHREDGRDFHSMRSMRVTYDVYPYAAGSVLFELGNTKVLCAVTLQEGVPHFIRGKKRGWLTAEYSLLPASTPTRTVRESSSTKKNGRTIEISRLIGRTLRSISDLEIFGERTLFIDCDVIQADGGTRAASITGAFLALRAAQERWVQSKIIPRNFLFDEIAALSVGVNQDVVYLDMNFAEDNAIQADFTFALTRSGNIVEIQGCAEQKPISWKQYDKVREVAVKGAHEVFEFFDMYPYDALDVPLISPARGFSYSAQEKF